MNSLSPITYCKRCCYPSNHPLYLTFEDGICSGCLVHEEKDQIEWQPKLEELKKLVNQYRTRADYDCIVPVSGGQDSYFVVHVVRNILGLNPLLVSFNRLYNTKIGISNLEKLRTRLGCDIISYQPNPEHVKSIARATLAQFGSFHWYQLAGHTVFPVQIAARMKIPLIIWGAHQGVDQVGMFSHHDKVEMSRRYRHEHDLMGFEPEDLVDSHPSLSEAKLASIFYPKDEVLYREGIRGIYLNNYIRWDSKAQHELMIRLYGFETQKQARTFDTYHDIHCAHYNGVHDLIKYIKFGYSKVTDQVCREIRLKRLSREQGLEIIQRYQNQRCEDVTLFEQYFGVTVPEVIKCQAVDSRLWHDRSPIQWYEDLVTQNQPKDPISFLQTTTRSGPLSTQTLARGWAPDFVQPAAKQVKELA